MIEHIIRMARDVAPDWPTSEFDATYRVDIEGDPDIHCAMTLGAAGHQARSRGDGRNRHAGRQRDPLRGRRAAWAAQLAGHAEHAAAVRISMSAFLDHNLDDNADDSRTLNYVDYRLNRLLNSLFRFFASGSLGSESRCGGVGGVSVDWLLAGRRSSFIHRQSPGTDRNCSVSIGDRDSQSACRTVGKQALSGTVGIEGSLIRRLRVRTQNERDEIRLKMPLRWAFGTVGSRHPADVWWPSDGLIYSARAGWQRRPTLVSIADPPLAVLVENESPSAGSQELCSLDTRRRA